MPLTNKEIRSALSSYAHTNDTRLYNAQNAIAQAAIAIVHCSELLVEVNQKIHDPDHVTDTEGKIPESLDKLADAVALTGHATHNLCLQRRDSHRPCLPCDTVGLCVPHIPIGNDWLYPTGTEFHKTLREAKDALRLSATKDRRRKSWTQQGHRSYGGHSSSNARIFWGRGHRPHNQWKGQNHGKAWHKNTNKRQ